MRRPDRGSHRSRSLRNGQETVFVRCSRAPPETSDDRHAQFSAKICERSHVPRQRAAGERAARRQISLRTDPRPRS